MSPPRRSTAGIARAASVCTVGVLFSASACANLLGFRELTDTNGSDASTDAVRADREGGVGCAEIRKRNDVVFCDDFDEPDRTTLGQGGWGPLYQQVPSGTISSDQAFSGQHSARFELVCDGGRCAAAAVLPVAFPADKSTIVVHAQVWTDEPFQGAGIALWRDSSGQGCRLGFDPTKDEVVGNCPGSVKGAPAAPITPRAWTAITLAVTRTTSGFHVALTVGSSTGTWDLDAPNDVLDPRPIVVLGGNYSNKGGVVFYDDVYVEVS